MALRTADPPSESVAALRDTLTTMGQGNQFSSELLRNADPDELALTKPHQVYTLGLDDLRAGQPLSAARPTSWRYLVERDDRPVALGETHLKPSGEHAFAQLNYGPFVPGTAQALDVAEQYVAQGDARIRFLHIPALYLQAVWLHSQSQASEREDMLVPAAPTPPGIEANRAYPAGELLGLLQERARSVPVMAEGDARGG